MISSVRFIMVTKLQNHDVYRRGKY
uniref:Uncharacterized protein n=1 Tax=Nymphaea colorata TaxID=210225 RepID=A0A5K0UZJ8_9MAGN